MLLSARKLPKEVTILLTKFTSVNLEDHNSQKATEGAILTFTPLIASHFKRCEKKQGDFFDIK